jgi:hypothetical protein
VNAHANPEEQLFGVFSPFGSIVSITVRAKRGTDKSWALVIRFVPSQRVVSTA